MSASNSTCLHRLLFRPCLWFSIFLILLALNAGCAKRAKQQKTASANLSSLYCRLPNASGSLGQDKSSGPCIITPQSELSQAICAQRKVTLEKDFRRASLSLGAPVYIRIFKESKELELWVQRGNRFYLFKKYPIAYFSGGLGPKHQEGDLQAPEGFYEVTPNRMNPRSNFHLAFNVGYPNEYDQLHQASGGSIMVHGKRNSVGCFAMTDPVIEEIYTIADQALNGGQPSLSVHIFPFRMTPANLLRHASSPHIDFWRNLLRGYTLFEQSHYPPKVSVENNMYAFAPGLGSEKKNVVSIQKSVQVLP